MKGIIADCLGKLIESKFGKDKWINCLEDAGISRYTTFTPSQDIPDADVLKVVQSVCKVLNLTLQQAADAFGDFWVNDYAPKIYQPYYNRSKSAKEFLLNMDNVHKITTESIPNAHPPRFIYDWENDNTLVMIYKS